MKLTRHELLWYARDGILMLIGSHPDPLNHEDEIEEYKNHLEQVEREIKKIESKLDHIPF